MTQLSNLIDPKVAAKMQQVAAKPKRVQATVPTCQCGFGVNNFKRLPGTNKVLMVHDECGLPTAASAKMFGDAYAEVLGTVEALVVDLRPLTKADAIDIDPESEAMIDVQCVDCQASMLMDPRPPEGADADKPRVPLCRDCGRARAKEAARKQRNVEIIRRAAVAKHQPRITDGIDHPVTVTTFNPKENDMTFDLGSLSAAEQAALVATATKRMTADKAQEVKKAAKKAKKARKAKEAAERAAIAASQKQRQAALPLPEFVVDSSLTVPALDLDVDLDTVVSAKERRPYNQARFRLLGEPALPHGHEPGEECTTYADLRREHMRLMEAAQVKAAERKVADAESKAAKKGKKAKKAKKVEMLVVDLNPKVAALMDALDCDEAEALKVLARLS